MALLKAKIIPNEIVAPYDLTKKLASLLMVIKEVGYEITKAKNVLQKGGHIPNKFLIIEDLTKSQKDAWRSFFVFNYLFKKMMVYKGPQEGRFFDMTDFLVISAL
jgi:hypothetical protein